ncbi:uncharacterized protein LOC134654648 isoform X1 [Cydia amplana]|uniref:uncharacterized protein LOC134654648 isoform X1 n=1 Tax=Cydia amplana TaxID=1869771 RepID=UPI002FE5BFA8
MEDLRAARDLISPNMYMATLDLKDAYFLVPMCKNSRKYLRFRFDGILYQFTCLPFGLSTSPYIFTKIMKPVMNNIRLNGWLSLVYLDDLLCISDTYESCKNNIKNIITFIEKLGFIINYKKSHTNPSKRCKYLGFFLDSEKYSVDLPDDKKNQIIKFLSHFKVGNQYKIRLFAQLLGVLVAASHAVQYSKIYCKRLERAKWLALTVNNDDFEGYMKITDYVKEDLTWWHINVLTGSNPIRTKKYKIIISSDASRSGWGAESNSITTRGFWSQDDKKFHINYLELLAAFFGLKCFASKLSNCEILMRIDNTTAISYINKAGGVKFPHLSELARKIWQWCESRKIWIVASYIASKDNVDADTASRDTNLDTEWELAGKYFKQIVKKFGTCSIDLFASRINTKCKTFCSRYPDPEASVVDAFTISWEKEHFYAFPPFAVILPVLRKIINDKATGIVVVPNWPTQAWYPMFTSLLCESPIILEPSTDLLLSPCRSRIHPLSHKLSLVVGKLSGRRT